MALFPLHPGVQPYGEFDILNTELPFINGGEVLTLTTASRTNTSTETAAADVLEDGYEFTVPVGLRPATVRASTAAQLPLFLSDDGTSPNYFTLFGRIVGANTGTTIANGTVLGPNSALATGKVTLWSHPGLYSVTTDALASDFVSSISLGAGLAVGVTLGFGSGADQGKICHNGCANKVAGSGCANLVEFSRNPSLVTTPAAFFTASATVFDRIVITWNAGNMASRTLT